MAERQFMIVIRNETDPKTPGDSSGAGGKGGVGKLLSKKAAALVSYGTIVSVADSIISHNNSLVEVCTGSRELQERTTYKYNTAKSFVNSAVAGGIGGAAYGPIGALTGAAIGLVSAGFSYTINRAKQEHTIRENERLEIAQRQMAAQRVTISGSRHMNATQM
jgi:hypothetical protein